MSESTPPTLRPELEALPRRMQSLHVDERGYPVPWFVPWIDDEKRELLDGQGVPEFRLMSQRKLAEAVKFDRCWVCGGVLGRYRAFTIGPMCLINRINAEPPSHVECAEWAARNCPFLARPHARRRDNDLPDDKQPAAGMMIRRNPGACVVYVVTEPYETMQASGVLFKLPPPERLSFWAKGGPATIAEVEASIESGLPSLLEVCQTDEERAEVQRRRRDALALVDRFIAD